LIRRIAEAGWQPVTQARCDNPQILIERFGPDAGGAVYLTLMNDSAQPQSGVVKINAAALKLKRPLVLEELVAAKELRASGEGLQVSLAPQEAWAMKVGAEP